MQGNQSTEVAVIGAGPYGLAVASHLLHAGVSAQVFGIPMGAWRYNMPAGMMLKSKWEATSIATSVPGSTFVEYCEGTGNGPCDENRPIPIELFVDYGLHIQQRHVPGLIETPVIGLHRSSKGFLIRLADGSALSANKVVAATGHACFAHIPSVLKGIASSDGGAAYVTHVPHHADFKAFQNRDVVVVGAGQSALESAVLLRETGARVHLVVRNPTLKWGGPPIPPGSILRRVIKPETPFGPGWSHMLYTRGPELFKHFPTGIRRYLAEAAYGPSGAWWLRHRFDEKIRVSTGTNITKAGVFNGKVHLEMMSSDGTEMSAAVDHVFAATGYRVDVNAIPYLDPSLAASIARIGDTGIPRLSRNFESSVDGLYFVGMAAAATFGPLQRFVYGSGFAAQTICRALAPRGRQLIPSQPAAA